MELNDFEKMRATFKNDNKLEILTEYNNLISKICENLIYKIDTPENLSEVLNIIKSQKNITDVAEHFFEYLQGDSFKFETANNHLDKLEYACEKFNQINKNTEKEKISDNES